MQNGEEGYHWLPPLLTAVAAPARRFVLAAPLRPHLPRNLDRFVVDLGQGRARYEVGHRATAEMFAAALPSQVAHQASRGLDRTGQKRVRETFATLLTHVSEVVPLTADVARLGVRLLDQFMESYSPKSKIRNSMNDMFLLAASINAGLILRTDDRLLADFGAQIGAAVDPVGSELFDITPSKYNSADQPARNQESKGYSNVPWERRKP